MLSKTFLGLAATFVLASGAQAACYTVMGPKGQILSETSTPPVDMTRQLHETVPQRFGPGTTMVFGLADSNCGPEADLTKPPAKTTFAPKKAQTKKTTKRTRKAKRTAKRRT